MGYGLEFMKVNLCLDNMKIGEKKWEKKKMRAFYCLNCQKKKKKSVDPISKVFSSPYVRK